MKAILDNDIIRNAGTETGVEIGSLPKGVGTERLRFNGTTLVDLSTLSQIWVKHLGGRIFELHAVEVSGSQLVDMTYANRKNLSYENGVIRVLDAVDLLNAAKLSALARIKMGFEAAGESGRCTLSLGWDIDCRRGPTTNDIQNCEIVLKSLQLQGAPDNYPISGPNGENGVKGADNLWHPCTLAQFRDVVLPEMYQYGLVLYGRKWQKEQLVEDPALTVAEANAVTF